MLTRSHFFCFVLRYQFSRYEGKAQPSSDEGWRPCVSWYRFQMQARLGGARALEQDLGLVVFSSRCDASCWFLHMFCWPYPNMAGLLLAHPPTEACSFTRLQKPGHLSLPVSCITLQTGSPAPPEHLKSEEKSPYVLESTFSVTQENATVHHYLQLYNRAKMRW